MKLGTDTPTRAMNMQTVSAALPRLMAATVPRTTPRIKGEDDGPDAQVEGHQEGLVKNGIGDRPVGLDGQAQVAPQAVAQVDEELLGQGLVQAVLGPQGLPWWLGQRLVADEGVAGQHVLQEEGQGHQHEQGDDGVAQALEHIFYHCIWRFLLSFKIG